MATQDYVTARRAADMTGLNERTIRRYISAGRLEATRLADGDYAIPVRALNGVRRQAKERATRRGDLPAEVAALRAEVNALTARLDALTMPPTRTHTGHQDAATATPRPTASPVRLPPQRAPAASGDRVYLRAFAEAHGCPGATALHHMAANAFAVTSERNPTRPDHRNHFLDGQDAQRAALVYWRASWRGDDGHVLRACDDPACVCHTLLGQSSGE